MYSLLFYKFPRNWSRYPWLMKPSTSFYSCHSIKNFYIILIPFITCCHFAIKITYFKIQTILLILYVYPHISFLLICIPSHISLLPSGIIFLLHVCFNDSFSIILLVSNLLNFSLTRMFHCAFICGSHGSFVCLFVLSLLRCYSVFSVKRRLLYLLTFLVWFFVCFPKICSPSLVSGSVSSL